MSDRAIYYPYIHIQDVNWLKATLLMFSEVKRMMPMNFTPEDSPFVQECAKDIYLGESGWLPPLVGPAPLWSERSVETQIAIAKKLQQDAEDPAFVERFGCYSSDIQQLPSGALGFQIHQGKLNDYLRKVLYQTQLAWDPQFREPYDHNAEYAQLHPRVGEVVMSALAIACANEEGLDIVGDQRSKRLHAALIQKDIEGVYNAWLHPTYPEGPPEATSESLFEFLLGFDCDLSNLNRERLATMQQDREPLRILLRKLKEIADQIPAMDPGPRQREYFSDAASRIIQEWQSDRANMSHYWRVFFGEGVAEPGLKFFEKVVGKVVEEGVGPAAAGAMGGAATGAAGGALVASVSGAAVGLGIGLVVHAGKSYKTMRKEVEKSPYRYLTLLEEKAGVVFQTAPM